MGWIFQQYFLVHDKPKEKPKGTHIKFYAPRKQNHLLRRAEEVRLPERTESHSRDFTGGKIQDNEEVENHQVPQEGNGILN